MILKRCSHCKQWLQPSSFARNRSTKDGLRVQCRKCVADYRRAHRNERTEYNKLWRQANATQQSDYQRQWRRAHPGYSREWYRLHQQDMAEYGKSYRRTHPEIDLLKRQRRRARKHDLPDTFTVADWQHAIRYFHGQCAVCYRFPRSGSTLTMDHWIPLSSPDCPGTVPNNILPLCKQCNSSKSSKPPLVWLNERYEPEEAAYIVGHISRYLCSV